MNAIIDNFSKSVKSFKDKLNSSAIKRSSRFDTLDELVDWLFEEAMGGRERIWESLALDIWKRIVPERDLRRELLLRKSN